MSLTSILPHGKKQYVAQFFTLESGEKNGNSAIGNRLFSSPSSRDFPYCQGC